MKKFLVLPIVLAIGFAILVIVNTESTGGGKQEGEVITTPSGLKITELKVGSGKEVKAGDTVVVHYTGTLADGKKFDSSLDSGRPATLSLNQVVQGWKEGIPGMKVGGKRKLVVPPQLGYGHQGFPPDIPPDAVLFFEIELIDVK